MAEVEYIIKNVDKTETEALVTVEIKMPLTEFNETIANARVGVLQVIKEELEVTE